MGQATQAGGHKVMGQTGHRNRVGVGEGGVFANPWVRCVWGWGGKESGGCRWVNHCEARGADRLAGDLGQIWGVCQQIDRLAQRLLNLLKKNRRADSCMQETEVESTRTRAWEGGRTGQNETSNALAPDVAASTPLG